MAMLTCIMSSITSCSNNKSNKDENGIDSAAIVQAKADSIASVTLLVLAALLMLIALQELIALPRRTISLSE